jgi:hypothetical protein
MTLTANAAKQLILLGVLAIDSAVLFAWLVPVA